MTFTKQGHGMTRSCFNYNTEEQEDSRICVEKMDCKLLLVAGQDDQSVPAVAMAQDIKAAMVKHGKGEQCELEIYPNAGHLIEPPYMPLCSASKVGVFKGVCAWGGHPKPHAHAEEDAWKKTKGFFGKFL